MILLPTLRSKKTGIRATAALVLSLSLAVSCALTGCGPSENAANGASNTAKDVSQSSAESAVEAPAVFVFGDTTFNAENEEPDVNPRNGYAGWAALRYGVGETLFRYDEHMRPRPWLAERFENVDPLTWKIELKENVRFSNGRSVDAAAVKASLEALVKEHARARGDLRIAAVEADGLTLTIRTEVPRPTLVNYLSDPYGAVVDVDAGVKDGIVVGTGPYRAVKVVANDSIELVRNENYWGETRPGYDRVRVLTISDGDTLTMALQSGEIDAAYGLPYASHVLFKKGGFVSTSTATSRTFFLHMNYKSPIASDPAVRRAVAMAVDKERFASVLLQGNGVPATGPFPADFAFGGKVVKARSFDLKAAAEVLERAPQLRLEHHDQRDNSQLKDLIEDPSNGIQLCHLCDQIGGHQKKDAFYQLPRPGFPDELNSLINDIRYQKDVQQIPRKPKSPGSDQNVAPYVCQCLHSANHDSRTRKSTLSFETLFLLYQ